MPEGPEILYTNIYLKKLLKNTQIETIKSFTDKPAIIPKDYIGEVEDVGCKGKLFWIKVSGKEKSYYIDIHYGITGWLEEEKPEKNIKFEFVIKKNNNYKYLYMEDKRRFSKVQIHTQTQPTEQITKNVEQQPLKYEQMRVDDLRKLVLDKQLSSKDEVKKLKKPELLFLLQKPN